MMGTVSFPGLGLEFQLNRVAFHVGSWPVYWYGIIIAAGFLLAVMYCSRQAPKFGIRQDDIIDMLFYEEPSLTSTTIIIIVVSVCTTLFIVAVIVVFLYRRRKSMGDSSSVDEIDNTDINSRNTLTASIIFGDGLQTYQDSITSDKDIDDSFVHQMVF